MHIFDVILRSVIQSVVLIVWGLFALAFVAGLTWKIIHFLWMRLHPVRAIVHNEKNNVIDAEWVREV